MAVRYEINTGKLCSLFTFLYTYMDVEKWSLAERMISELENHRQSSVVVAEEILKKLQILNRRRFKL
jgi:hypothetical protein